MSALFLPPKTQHLGWGEGLAKHEKTKVDPEDILDKEAAARNGMVDGVTGSEPLLTSPASLTDKSPNVNGYSECGSPATPYSYAYTSSPVPFFNFQKPGLTRPALPLQFSDMTFEEFSKQKIGATQNCFATQKGNHKLTRKTGIVSPVKNQGSCGSCWTFSTTGGLEAAYAQAFGKSVSLSKQQLVDCARDFNNFGCNGGLPSQAYEYIKYNSGLDTEESYPYTGKDGVCKYKSENVAVKVIDSVNITMGAEDELKHAVGVVHPMSVAFQVINGFHQYTGGVFTSDVCGNDPIVREIHVIFDFRFCALLAVTGSLAGSLLCFLDCYPRKRVRKHATNIVCNTPKFGKPRKERKTSSLGETRRVHGGTRRVRAGSGLGELTKLRAYGTRFSKEELGKIAEHTP
uniref:Peptidase C1A papain C-terminal domain-containing protein n=1 Tax=Lactuca sativa TaxID=4236 RepID=A0A9R1WQW7_LACSA|nr:hypothetical protein LSAT_V11C100047300 [Lactuca sativa]